MSFIAAEKSKNWFELPKSIMFILQLRQILLGNYGGTVTAIEKKLIVMFYLTL